MAEGAFEVVLVVMKGTGMEAVNEVSGEPDVKVVEMLAEEVLSLGIAGEVVPLVEVGRIVAVVLVVARNWLVDELMKKFKLVFGLKLDAGVDCSWDCPVVSVEL